MKGPLLSLLLTTTLTGCTALQAYSVRKQSTPPTPVAASSAAIPLPQTRVIPLSREVQQSGLLVRVDEISIEPNAIAVRLTIRNPTDQALRFYPNQGTATIGTQTLTANALMSGQNLSGPFEPGEVQAGTLVFMIPDTDSIDPTKVMALQLSLGKVLDMETINPPILEVSLSLNPT